MRTNTIIKRTLAIVAGGAIAAAACAQDLGIKAPPQNRPIAITKATIHPVSGPSIPNGHVLFEKGRITSVGPGDGVLPLGTLVIEAKGKHVYPGLFGAYSQMGLSEIGSIRATEDHRETGGTTPEVYAAVAVNPDSTLIPVTRANGILLQGVFPTGGLIPGRVSVMQMEGWTYEDMTVDADVGLVVGFPQTRQGQNIFGRADEAAQRRLDEAFDALEDLFKRSRTYRELRARDGATPVDARLEGVLGVLPEAGENGGTQNPVYLMVNEVEQIEAAVRWAVERKLRPVIVGGRDAHHVTDLLKKHDVPVIIVATHKFPKRSDSPYNESYTQPALLEKAGVRWAIASGEETPHERNLPYHVAQALAHGEPMGLTHDAAVRSVTLTPAQILGVSGRVGSLEIGKDATLIVTDGDPLEVRTHTEMAFIQGKTLDMNTKHTALYKKYLEKYRQLGLIRR
ncbi:MAG: amidohydrolase family protein [Phycisphaeraceae bacterium]|nr:amidohydrolase family protein [Phycisphaeraceae bacterium]MBX3368534.1 amidohydrolase family protein [Phycisphaeraceae bacterium]